MKEINMCKMLPLVLAMVATIGTSAMAQTAQLPSPTPAKADLDVMGLKVGTTVAQTTETLRNLGPGVKIVEQKKKWPDGSEYVETITAELGDTQSVKDTVFVIFSAPVSGNRSLVIQRHSVYAAGNKVSKLAAVDALHQKYGVTSVETMNGAPDLRWFYGADGTFQNNKRLEGCANISAYVQACGGVVLQANLSSLGPTNPLADEMVVVLKDNAFGMAALRLDDEARQKAAQEQAEKLRSSTPKVKL